MHLEFFFEWKPATLGVHVFSPLRVLGASHHSISISVSDKATSKKLSFLEGPETHDAKIHENTWL